jgi:hypothetical protein
MDEAFVEMELRPLSPKLCQRSIPAEDGIAIWQRNTFDILERCRPVAWLTLEQIPILARRIGANDKQSIWPRKPLVTGSGWQNDNIAGCEIENLAGFAAEPHSHAAARYSERLVGRRMIVMEIVDAVSPLRRPIILGEQLLGFGRWIRSGRVEGPAVEQHRKSRIIGDRAVVRKSER